MVQRLIELGALEQYRKETSGRQRVQFEVEDDASDESEDGIQAVNSPLNWAAFKVCVSQGNQFAAACATVLLGCRACCDAPTHLSNTIQPRVWSTDLGSLWR